MQFQGVVRVSRVRGVGIDHAWMPKNIKTTSHEQAAVFVIVVHQGRPKKQGIEKASLSKTRDTRHWERGCLVVAASCVMSRATLARVTKQDPEPEI